MSRDAQNVCAITIAGTVLRAFYSTDVTHKPVVVLLGKNVSVIKSSPSCHIFWKNIFQWRKFCRFAVKLVWEKLNSSWILVTCSYPAVLTQIFWIITIGLDNNNRATVTRHNNSKWPRKCESKIKWFRNLLRIQRVSLKTLQINLSDVSRLGVYSRFFVYINVGANIWPKCRDE